MRKELIELFTPLVDFLGIALGPDYEVVLLDTSSEKSGVAAIANNHISGRSIGSPITNVSLSMIMNREYEKKSYITNYIGKLDSGKIIRSSTFFIKENNRLEGMLCLNYDDTKFHELGDKLLKLVHPDQFIEKYYRQNSITLSPQILEYRKNMEDIPGYDITPEYFYRNNDELIADTISDVLSDYDIDDAGALSPSLRKEIVTKLLNRGLFNVKGAVACTAKTLNCSVPSIYRYISTIKDET